MHPQEVGATEWLANLSIGYVVLAAFVLTLVRLALVPLEDQFARSIAELAESLIIAAILVFLIVRPFFVQAFYIPSESMEPTLMGHDAGYNPATNTDYPTAIHDHIFVNKLVYRLRDPRRGEIIVFRAEKKADTAGGGQHENVLIKRLIAIPGDTVEIKKAPDGQMRVFLNGRPLIEKVANPDGSCTGAPYCIKAPMDDPQPEQAHYAEGTPLHLGPNQLFVMGDNRNNSNDSRFWGTLPRNRVIGKAEVIFWPLSRIRILH